MESESQKSAEECKILEVELRDVTLKLQVMENWKKMSTAAGPRAAAALLQVAGTTYKWAEQGFS